MEEGLVYQDIDLLLNDLLCFWQFIESFYFLLFNHLKFLFEVE